MLPHTNVKPVSSGGSVQGGPAAGPVRSEAGPEPTSDVTEEHHPEAVEFVRFCYRRRSVAWPELYDEMCAVAARGEFRGMTYEQLERLGIGFALAALPKLAAMAARVIAEERSRGALPATG